MKKNLLSFNNTKPTTVDCKNPNCKKIKGSPGNYALRIVKQLLFAFMVLLLIQGMARGQDPASATWALTTDGNASTSGNVTATPLYADYGVNIPQYSFIGVFTSGWCNSSLIMNGHDYYEFTISPKTGHNLTVTNIAFLHSKSGSVVGNGAIYYSLDDFSSSAQLGSNFLIENIVPLLSFSNSTSITVPDGHTLKIRIYAWGLDCSDAFYIKDFIISGTTGSILSVTPAKLDFGEVCPSLSNELTFNLTGSFLTGAVSINAPVGFSVLPASVTPSGGRIDETISVIFNPDAVKSYSGNVTVSGGGANSVNVVVTGNGKEVPSTATNPSPANGATGLSYTGSGAVSNVSWDAVSGATSYDVYFGAGSLPGSPTANVGTHSYSTGVLSASTTYHWKIVPKNDCGATTGTPVEWTFTTINPPIITVSAASLDFGAACLNSNSPEQSYTISGTSLTGTIEIIPPSGFVISFDGGESFDPNYSLKITSSDGTGSISNIPIYVRFAPNAAQTYSGNISHSTTGATTKNVAVTGTGITAPSVAANPYPSNGATGICYTGSDAISSVSWDPVPGAASYDIYFGPGSLPVSPSANVTYNTYLFWDDLSASTTYHWKVVPKNGCGATTGTPAEWTFTTNDHLCYCRPSSNTKDTYIHNFSAAGDGTSDISNSGTGYSPVGYADYSESQSVSQFTNQLVNWSLTMATPGGVRPAGFSLWVDWNNNGFGAGDNVYITSSSQVPGTYTGSFVVPSGIDPGDYKMRVFVDANNGSPNDPCNFTPYYFYGNQYLGEAEDYTLQVKAGNPPVISVSTASLSFGEVCVNAGSLEQVYTVSGSDLITDIVVTPPAGFEISKTSGTGFANNAVTLTQLAGSVTSIPVYVRVSPTSTGEVSGNIIHTSSGATVQNIAVTGTGIAAPAADFTGSPTTVKTGESITFTNISANTPTSWSWSFPGGSPSSSTGQNPMVTYDVAGTYSVSFTATNGCGSDTETKTDYITVTALCITPVATAPSSGDGTSGNPYQIASLENLYWISASDDVVASPSQAARFGSHYIQVADIDASATVSWCNGGWNPIGYDNDDNWFMFLQGHL
jgi:PKD repeat protein